MEMPEEDDSELVGEDMHFSFMLQKYAGIKTFVPPHPQSQPELWGSNAELGWKMGQDSAAISMNHGNLSKMNAMYRKNIERGFVPMKFKQ